ncbi:MFS transporter [Burkholderia sp. Tr-862]|uniref:MFS transporter n=1 Tax=Burkholderia sp. Tr-862 TaxID=2608331 RepID=UPI001FFD2B98|nr:MFS transporter [Burkholderia sp. Tr-862]
MQAVSPSDRGPAPVHTAAWGAVLAMALGAFALVASEFMPVSLLTPIAHDLRISEGQAGQAISVSGAFALLTSLFISSLAGRRDRKRVLLSLTLLMIVSGTVVAFAPNYLAFIAGRALIGVAIGGFWSMSAATAMRLVPDRQVPRALAIVNGGNALATVVAAPLGSLLGGMVGWRWAFFCVVPVAAIAFGWKLASLPRMHAAHGSATPGRAFALLANAPVALAIARHLRARFGAAWQEKAALLSIDDPEWAELIGITTIRQPTYEIGYKAVEFVHERIDGAAGDVRVAMLPGELIARASTAS